MQGAYQPSESPPTVWIRFSVLEVSLSTSTHSNSRNDEHEHHADVDKDVGAAEESELAGRKTVDKAMSGEYANIEPDDLYETVSDSMYPQGQSRAHLSVAWTEIVAL
jgi:hypothetical protein